MKTTSTIDLQDPKVLARIAAAIAAMDDLQADDDDDTTPPDDAPDLQAEYRLYVATVKRFGHDAQPVPFAEWVARQVARGTIPAKAVDAPTLRKGAKAAKVKTAAKADAKAARDAQRNERRGQLVTWTGTSGRHGDDRFSIAGPGAMFADVMAALEAAGLPFAE